MLPEPEAVHVPPPAPTQVQVQVRDAGKVSATVAPVALLGPALAAVIVEGVEAPAVTVVTPSVLVIDRSALTPIVSLSVAELLPGVGSVAPAGAAGVAVFDSVPVAAALIVQLAVKVTLPPDGRFTVWLMFPEPDAVQVPP